MKLNYYISVLLLACSTLAIGQNPGGVAGSRLWMRSDLGTGSTTNNAQVYGWNDQSGNGYNAWVSGNMYYKDNATDNINFNPVHYFNGSSNFNVNNIGIRSPGTPVYDYTIIAVGRREVSGGGMVFGDAQNNGNDNTLSFGYSANNKAILTHKKNNLTLNVNNYNNVDVSPFLLQGAYDQTSGRSIEELRDGNFTTGTTNKNKALGDYSGFRIGSSADPDYDNFTGHMAEVVVYRTLLSDIEKLQVYSYLGIKYGITLTDDLDDDGNANEVISGSVREGDYVASDGSTVIWDYTSQGTGYYNQVAGIGRDDGSDLDQRQAKSQDPEALLTIGNSDIFTTNFTNTNSFSADKTFMLWANNGGNNSFTTSGAPSGRAILARAWRVQETGTVGKVKIQVPASTSSLNSKLPAAGTLDLFVDTDGDFTSGAVSHAMVLNGTNWEVEINLADGDYFTFAKGGAELSITTQGQEQGPTHAVVTVLLPEVNTTGAAFTFDIIDNLTGTATSGSDYAAIPAGAKISVANGAQTGTYTINIIDDAVAEALETIDVSISNPSGSQFFVSQGDVTVTISDNDAGPGGVKNNLNVWLKADLGTSSSTDNTTVSTWTDQSSSGHDGLGDGNPPTYKNNTADNINFNPSLYFDGSDDRLLLDLDDIKSGRGNGNGKHTLIAVGQRTNSSRAYVLGSQGGSYQEELFFGYENNNTARWDNVATALNLSVNNYNSPAESPYMIFGMFNGAGREFEETRDATLTRGTDSYNVAIQGSRSNYIGDIESYSSHYNGKISEIIVFDSTITNLEKQQIYSYLALKYGLGISDDANANATTNEVISGSVREGDLVSSDGTVLWDYAARGSEYFNDVAGIGQDNVSGLLQKQSVSISSDALVRIGLDTIAENNLDNPGAFSADKTFLVWGNNDSTIAFTSYGAPSGSQVLSRKWQVQETGTLGAVLVQVPASTSSSAVKLPFQAEMSLLTDSDGDFTTGATIIPMTLVGDNWEAKVDFASGQYFTFSDCIARASLSVLTHGNETGPVDISFQVKLDAPNSSGSTITYDIADAGTGTATSGSDHTAISAGAKISIANGDSVGTYTVAVIDDSDIEGVEYLDAIISNPSNNSYPVSVNTATASITSNDVSGPGAVSDQLVFWLRADTGTGTTTSGLSISQWVDQTGNANDASSSGTAPLYERPVVNYNPAVNFGGNGGFNISNDADINTSVSTKKSFCVAFKTGADITTRQLIYEEGGGTHGLNVYIENGEIFNNLWVSSVDNAASTTIQSNTMYILSFVYNGGAGRWDAYLNGNATHKDLSAPASFPGHSGGIGLGRINSTTQYNGNIDVGSGDGFTGHIMEMAYYNSKSFSYFERARIETYLALKYGVNLQNKYLASNGLTVIWDTLTNHGFTNNVNGIGVDEQGYFLQKQSLSASILAIGLDTIVLDNLSNTSSFGSSSDYLLWGDDGGFFGGISNVNNIESQSGIVDQLQRTWKVVETGAVGSVKMAFVKDSVDNGLAYLGYGSLYLRIADNDSLNLNPTEVELDVESINGADYYVAEYDFTDSAYFSLVQKGFIIWNGSEWRGGLSAINPHGPSDDPLDEVKPMYVLSGDTAGVSESVLVAEAIIDSNAVLQMNPQSCLTLATIINDGSLILRADSSGFAQYDGPAVEATFEQYIDDAGWHLIGSPFSDATWSDLKFSDTNTVLNHPLGGTSLDSCSYCNLWWYDAGTDNGTDIGFGSSDAFGTWRSSANVGESFSPDRGWNLWLDEAHGFSSAPWTVYLSGTLNDGDVTQIVNENNAGWNLVANPYPSALDWDVVDDDLAAAGIAGGYHIWDHENTNYAVYGSGTGTLGLTQHIAPFQGFYVQTSTVGAQNSGDVFRDFDLANADRPSICTGGLGNFYKSGGSQEIVLQTIHVHSGKKDETIIVLSDEAQRAVYPQEDIRKLFTPYKDAPSLYSRMDLQNLSIASVPYPMIQDSIQLGTVCKDGSRVTIEAIRAPAGYTIYLEDIKTGQWHRIDEEAYSFTQESGLENRFWLHFGPGSIEAKPWNASNPFSIFVRNDHLVIKTLKSVISAEWYLTSTSGQVMLTGQIYEGEGFEHEAYIGHLAAGTYVFRMKTRDGYFAEKIVIL